ncbi:MAG: DUF1592 domain-containing protein, partial [Prosthecobacter sp.]
AGHTGTGESSETIGQGIKLDKGTRSGRLPLASYLDALQGLRGTEGLSPKYLGILRKALTSTQPSAVLDPLRAKFKAGQLKAADIEPWQKALWRFANVSHLGKVGGPKAWLDPVTPLAEQNEFRMKLPSSAAGGDLTIYFTTSDAGDGAGEDFALWENARLILPGRGETPLRDVGSLFQQMERQRTLLIATAERCLAAAHEFDGTVSEARLKDIAQKHGVDAGLLAGWLNYLGIAGSGALKLEPLLVNKTSSVSNYNFIKGWSGKDALSVLANSSDTAVSIPGRMKPMSIATHPAPKQAAVIAWRSPVAGALKISGSVQDGHIACGNGILYALELRSGQTREVLASGESKADKPISLGPFEKVRVATGDVIALVIEPKGSDHACDHTPVNLTLSDGSKEWDLAKDVAPDILAGNPHADRHGNKAVWHFISQPASGALAPTIPADGQSLLSRWRRAVDAGTRAQIATQIQRLLQQEVKTGDAAPADRELRSQLLAYNGPLLADTWRSVKAGAADASTPAYGLDAALHGRHPRGGKVAATSVCVQAPSILEVRLPAAMLSGAELVVTARIHPASAPNASVQMQVLNTRPAPSSGLQAAFASTINQDGAWTNSKPPVIFDAPILVKNNSEARKRFERAFDDFRSLFPAALCYTKIVPVDEVVTLTLFHREDDQLRRLILDEAQASELDRLWDELHFVSQDAITLVDAFEQIWQYSTQDGPNAPNGDKRLEPLRDPIMRGAEAFKKRMLDLEPTQVKAMLEFAGKAWRRPLDNGERSELNELYSKLRQQDLPHIKAMRLMLARVLTSPAFLYRGEKAPAKTGPVSTEELATRLSYFLWSSAPDEELRTASLQDTEVLVAQARRMLKSNKVRRLALEFGCQYLHVHDVATLDEKSERHFPTFLDLRDDMQEEVTRFFIDLIQNNRSIISLLDADHTFVNAELAKHYGLKAGEWGQKNPSAHSPAPILLPDSSWHRVEQLHAQGRGGILGFAATLAKQAGASRTSAILRGTWLTEVVLGEKLPTPPKGVPTLPEEAPADLTERQLIERHSRDENCMGCHKRIDPYGFALEGFDAIGRARKADTKTVLPDGTAVDGISALRNYLLTKRSDDFTRQFCRKLLGYALGRSVQLSDKPLIDQMMKSDFCFGTLVEHIVRSRQFREKQATFANSPKAPSQNL